MKKSGVGLADEMTRHELAVAVQADVPRARQRWANRGIDAMFAVSVEQAYQERYRSAWVAHKGRLIEHGGPHGAELPPPPIDDSHLLPPAPACAAQPARASKAGRPRNRTPW